MGAFSVLSRRKDNTLKIERPEFYVQVGSMFENPFGVPHEEIIRMIEENPAEVSAQVVFGKYVESSGLVFTGELVQMLFDRSLPVVRGQSYIDKVAMGTAQRQLRRSGWTNQFVTGVDFARQTDFTVIFTIQTHPKPGKVVYYKRLNRVSWDSIYAEVGRARYLFGPNVLCDGTGPGGDVSMDNLQEAVYCPEHHAVNKTGHYCMRNGEWRGCNPKTYAALDVCDAFHFTGTTKKELIENLRNVLAKRQKQNPDNFGLLRCPPIPQLEEELTFYAWDDKKLMTDCLFALALAAWLAYEEEIGEASVGSPFGE